MKPAFWSPPTVRPSLSLLVLPGLHVLLCILVALHPNTWQWFPVFMIDLPLSILLEQLVSILPATIVYSVLGTLWWYLLGCMARFVYRRAMALGDVQT